MIKHLDHIAIKVNGISRVCKALEELGLSCNSIEKFDEVGMRIAFLGPPSGAAIELLEVINKDSPIADEPSGLHHLGIKVENIEEIYDKMKKSDKYRLQGEIRNGAHSRIFFFRLSGQEEILFECVE